LRTWTGIRIWVNYGWWLMSQPRSFAWTPPVASPIPATWPTPNGPSSNRCCLRLCWRVLPGKPSFARLSMPLTTSWPWAVPGRLYPMIFSPPEGTVRDDFHQGRRRGLWQQIHETLRSRVREAAGKDSQPSAGSIVKPSKRLKPVASGVTTQAKRSTGSSGRSWWIPWGCCWPWWFTRRTSKTVMAPNWSSPRPIFGEVPWRGQ